MAPKKTLLDQMRDNPLANWQIPDIKRVCRENDIELENPSGGSHYKAISPVLYGHQTIPARRPIKPVYIRLLVAMIDAHRNVRQQRNLGGNDD